MKHARQKIREAAATALAGITDATIYRSRVYPKISLPTISVYCNREASEQENELLNANHRYTRRLQLLIEITVEAITGADDAMDDLAAQVEAAIASDHTLSGNCTDLHLQATDISLGGGAEVPIAVARLTYEVWYRTTAADAETSL